MRRTRMELRSILVLLESYHQTCMTYTSAEYTVQTCRWWAEELPETCRVSWQNKFGKLVRLVGFIIKKIGYDARSHEFKYINVYINTHTCNHRHWQASKATHTNTTCPSEHLNDGIFVTPNRQNLQEPKNTYHTSRTVVEHKTHQFPKDVSKT